MGEGEVTIELTKDEALVLFDLLARFGGGGGLAIEDQAEERVLWDIHCSLERVLVEPFDPDYAELLARARSRVRD